ncbi:penicillin-binding protein activator [Octadecabacter sp. SW4]|uniref:penicillin-binding protein activator n=1 Tax=Octadecabacter sp. SW4 TaxID=2602067 RepID=UPI0011C1FDDB|nr:penicillin-binding protein activator [Octadecabacter sp. SW4]QEE36649.1 penicillin-binding protein activator [Octadecabacter sp. SW4]
MFTRLPSLRKAALRLFAAMSLLWLAACDPTMLGGTPGNGGPSINPSAPVQVALLVPGGSGQATDSFLAQNLENAARMAIADLNGVAINLRVYNTAGNPQQAAAMAAQAINDGARIIIGPLYAEAANAAGLAAAQSGVNVLAFSNNTTIAGGNVFVLGATFRNTADRLVGYSTAQGLDRILIAHADDLQGNLGRDAIAAAARANGATVTGVQSYAFSQDGIFQAAGPIAAAVSTTGAEAVFVTGGVNADLPILATALPDRGFNPGATPLIGLTRWNAAPQALSLPGLQGGYFALPDQGMTAGFESRYTATYGEAPHPLAGLAYDGIAAVGALVADGNRAALTRSALTQRSGFQGTSGIFRLLPNGTNERGLAVAQIRNNQVVIVDPAPRSFGGAGL